MNDAAELGRLIRESRLRKGMSLAQLAAAVGRSSSSVRRWERGEVPPAKAIVGDLAAALDLEVSDLDALRPVSSIPETSDPPDDPPAEEPKHTTLEQPIAAATPAETRGEPSGETRGETRGEEAAPPPARPPSRSSGLVADLVASYRRVTEDWSSWIRGALTVGVLIVMLVVLIWALGELFGAIGDVWDSFDADTNP